MKFSWKIFFITFLIIITSFGAGGFLLINTVFTNTLNNRIDSAKKNNNYITTALSVYADNNQPTYGNLEYLRASAIGFAKQIAGNSDSKIKIGSINELSFSAENEFVYGMSANSRKSRIVTENKKYYIQTISKIQLVSESCYIETVDDITSVYSDRDMYCTIYQFILIGVALFASILLVIFSKLLTRPLVKLKNASKEVAEGNFNMRVKESHGITSSTEITELSQSFNTMADYVVEMNIPDQQIEKLEEISEQMKQEELPKTREEFEGRALLYHILMDLEEFLVYKKRFVNGLDEKKLRIYWKQEMEQKDSANELQK